MPEQEGVDGRGKSANIRSGPCGSMQNSAPSGIPALAYHVVHRGWRRRRVFQAERDFARYLALLGEHSRCAEVPLLGFCLMPNHVHLLLGLCPVNKAAAVVEGVHNRYAEESAEWRALTRPVWNPRWFLAPLDFNALWSTLRYVELNPVRSALADKPEAYRWSSAAAHIAASDALGILDLNLWKQHLGGESWGDELRHWHEARALHHPPLRRSFRGAMFRF
jgi:REP element-mobilizing transposase RayT